MTGVACSPIEVDPDTRGQTIIPRSGKADSGLSCQGACGKKAPGGCWCDALCATYGDCCPDKSSVCDKRPGSCQKACGKKSIDGCWCDELCAGYGDCCPDKTAVCNPAATCTTNADCKSTEYCEFAKGACLLPTMNILQGTCKARPQACTADCPGVCGCDGKTYCNACGAAAVGVSVGKDGSCTPPDPCAAMDVTAVGPCAMALGWSWDGKNCVGLSGCSCSGKDCGKLYTSQTACEAAFAKCKKGCTKDADCRLFADYCDSVCACVPLGVNAADPTCAGAKCSTDAPLCLDQVPACETATGTCVAKAKTPPSCADAHVNASNQCVGSGGGSCSVIDCATACKDIDQKYQQAVGAAKQCNPFIAMPQCESSVDSGLMCPCKTFVNGTPPNADIAKYAGEWKTRNCSSPILSSFMGCPPMPCPLATSATCDGTQKVCIDNS